MRNAGGTKYEKVNQLPKGALTIANYREQNPEQFKSNAYVHIKFDRYKFGIKDKKGGLKFGAKPPYKIVDFQGIAFVIPD